MSLARRARLKGSMAQLAAAVLGACLVIWSLVPLYNMVRVALQENEFHDQPAAHQAGLDAH